MTLGGIDAEAPADDGTVRIDGDVTTGILGADAEWHRLLAGVAVSISEGNGTFDYPGVDSGTIESSTTTVSPYGRVKLNERVSAWGLVGLGAGDMTIVQAANDRGQPERATRTDIAVFHRQRPDWLQTNSTAFDSLLEIREPVSPENLQGLLPRLVK